MITNLNMKTCLRCGQCFYSDVATTNYCSRACWDAAGRPREGSVHQPNATCEVCGKAYWVQPSKLERSRFCSFECQIAYRSTLEAKIVHIPNATCETCGKEYWVKPSQRAKTRFCSRVCQDIGRRRESEISKEDLSRLYNDQRLSMQQIADKLNISAKRVQYLMDQFGLERRTWSEATYIAWNPDGDPFCIHEPQTLEEHQLFALAIGLYMGEGTRNGIHEVALANTNPNVLKIFIRFMIEICGVQRDKLRLKLNVYDDCDVEEAINWWCNQVNLKKEQFFAPTIRLSRGGTHIQKSQYGTVTVAFGNVKLKSIIMRWCEEYFQRFA